MPARATNRKPAPRDWRKCFREKKEPRLVVLETDFAGIRAGSRLFIATPEILARYIAGIPAGETRTIPRMRNELARRHKADATSPVTTAIFLRVVAEAAWDALQDGTDEADVVPFWRVIEPGTPIARKLRCDSQWLAHMREHEAP